uniref:TLC domain-containing protein n=1 Tax=Pyramimonas obovata TaxID=1411642 RepID=A0A7S0N8J4_9CHLO|mmetsp:Transcript_21755/g.47799  ORF Transcript_21755/g.47799 Transcript_21755/m.47799 type:complete len:311 (+) Transcript_21755:299-1231(+)
MSDNAGINGMLRGFTVEGLARYKELRKINYPNMYNSLNNRLTDSDFTKPDFDETTRDLFFFTSFCCISYAVLWFMVPRHYAEKSCHMQRIDLLFSAVYYPILTFLAIDATLVLGTGTVEQRWQTVTRSSYSFEILFIGGNLAHIPVTFLKKQTLTYKLQLLAHHLLAIGCFVRTCYTGVGHFYVALDGCCEISTIFLNNVFLFKNLGVAESKFSKVLNAVLLWVSYFLSRIVLFPAWLAMYFWDVSRHPQASLVFLTPVEQVVFPLTNVILFLLSSIWMVSITKGALKALRGEEDDLGPYQSNDEVHHKD